ncbi:MAG: hypothetical protein LBH20_04555, partial [Treponema sp.]|nr:hypothetical protein [Treponema sp.]
MALFKLPVKGAVFVLCVFISVLFPSSLYSSGKSEKKKKAAETVSPAQESVSENKRAILAGTDEGLFAIDPAGKMTALWSGGSVKKILFAAEDTWAILGSEGVLISNDLQKWEQRNQGLPVKTIKIFQDGKKTFLPMVQEIKDLKINPANPQIMVCATKDQVYLSRNQGQSWTSLGAPPYRTNGIKAVASAYMPRSNSGG